MPLFKKAGFIVYDCIKDFSDKCSNNSEYSKHANIVNDHPGTATENYYADYAFKFLLRDYPEILGKKCTVNIKSADISVNDWCPVNDREDMKRLNTVSIMREHFKSSEGVIPDPSRFKTLLNPVAEDRTVKFTYSDQWDRTKYLYMPMFAKTVKICFEFPVYASEFVIKDSDGNICKDFDAWCSYIGNKNYEEFDENKLNRDESGKFLNSHENITALNLHRDYKIHGEKNYFIEFK